MALDCVDRVAQTCEQYCLCRHLAVHGVSHLMSVAATAARIAHATGEDVMSATVGGFLHDCARQNDGNGEGHARESAQMARSIIVKHFGELDVNRICSAIADHAAGKTTADGLAAAIWDADRLDLARLGIVVDPAYLSTALARRLLRFRRLHGYTCRGPLVSLDGEGLR